MGQVEFQNERYRGVVFCARTNKFRNPQTGKKVQRPAEKSIRVEMPEQRIVSEKLWNAVQERLAFVSRKWGVQGRKGGMMNSRAASSPYIFSGLLKCGVCGGNCVLISGVSRGHRSATYGCPFHSTRGTCTNTRTVARDSLERELLAKLQRDVLSDAAIDYALDRVGHEINKRFAALNGEMDSMRRRKEKLESELRNLSRTIADGLDSVSIRAAIRASSVAAPARIAGREPIPRGEWATVQPRTTATALAAAATRASSGARAPA